MTKLDEFAKGWKPRQRGPRGEVERLPKELLDTINGYYDKCRRTGARPDHVMLADWLRGEKHPIKRQKLGHYWRERFDA